jgi:hypothetical protein
VPQLHSNAAARNLVAVLAPVADSVPPEDPGTYWSIRSGLSWT